MAKNTRTPEDDSANELNREEAEALPVGHDVAPVGDAPWPAPVIGSVFDEFEAEKVKLTAACKAWIRKELELFGLGHSAQDRAEMNP